MTEEQRKAFIAEMDRRHSFRVGGEVYTIRWGKTPTVETATILWGDGTQGTVVLLEYSDGHNAASERMWCFHTEAEATAYLEEHNARTNRTNKTDC